MSQTWQELMEFLLPRLPQLWQKTGEHLYLTGMATMIAVCIGVPLGIVCHRIRLLRSPALAGVGILQTIPSLAMLALLLSVVGMGVLPAIIALILYALLPVVRNTVTGLEGVPEQTMEAARGVGMTTVQRLWRVRIPLALPVIVAGIRTAAVIGVGIATLSTYIGAGGLGDFINRGLAVSDTRLILLGAIPAILLALLVDGAIWAAEWSTRPIRQSHNRPLRLVLKPLALAAPLLLILFGITTTQVSLQSRTLADGTQHEQSGWRRGTEGTIRIGSKEFAEQLLLGEMMAQIIENRTHLTVERKLGLGGTPIVHGALMGDSLDLYAEYTGTGYRSILNREGDIPGPYTVFSDVRNAYRDQFALEWLEPFGFYNSFALTVRKEDAETHGWKTVSDLKPDADELTAGFTAEFQEREDGYIGLKRTYGFQFGEARDMSPDLMTQALEQGDVDVICAFTTDGRIQAYDLQPLVDNRNFWPPYDAAPVIRREFLNAHPEVEWALGQLAGLLDNETMQRLNYRMQGEEKVDPADVAREFLLSKGLIKE